MSTPAGQPNDSSLRMTSGACASAVPQCTGSWRLRAWLRATAGMSSRVASMAAAMVPE